MTCWKFLTIWISCTLFFTDVVATFTFLDYWGFCFLQQRFCLTTFSNFTFKCHLRKDNERELQHEVATQNYILQLMWKLAILLCTFGFPTQGHKRRKTTLVTIKHPLLSLWNCHQTLLVRLSTHGTLLHLYFCTQLFKFESYSACNGSLVVSSKSRIEYYCGCCATFPGWYIISLQKIFLSAFTLFCVILASPNIMNGLSTFFVKIIQHCTSTLQKRYPAASHLQLPSIQKCLFGRTFKCL